MEAFTLLKYWPTGGGTTTGSTARRSTKCDISPTAATPYSDYGFDGPYYDLDFTLSDDNQEAADETSETTETEDLSESGDDYEQAKEEADLRFNSLTSSGGVVEKSDVRIFTEQIMNDEAKGSLVSLFARDEANGGKGLKKSTQNFDGNSVIDERNLGKEMLHKYLNMFKPLYIRGAEKVELSGGGGGPEGDGAENPAAENGCVVLKGRSSLKSLGNLQAGLKVMRKHLGKSRPTPAAVAVSPLGSSRRDDSMLEREDGIQGAILHCKRSFNSNSEGQSAVFSRSVSDSSYEKSLISPDVSSEGKLESSRDGDLG